MQQEAHQLTGLSIKMLKYNHYFVLSKTLD